jgi:hypothetical protein
MKRSILILISALAATGSAAAQAVPGGPPGSIRLHEGYQHQRLQGIDTEVGRIWKDNGPEIRYDIGSLSGHHASQLEPRRWSKRQTLSGRSFTLTMGTDDVLVLTFDKDTANFFVKGIRNQEELVEVILMLLAY